ncbi:MAG: hypothetical protein JRI25_07415 [Deltaproteobacteria bacterium]|nr:hypothetical protein [Deltaproteobacteria bacterium]MBW2254410.1 hypothetical protein [Deltaproteobacteria bacterium]
MTGTRFALLTFPLLFGACVDLLGEGDTANRCDEDVALYQLDERSPLGFTAEDVLENALGTRWEAASWVTGDGITEITFTLAWDGGPVLFHDLEDLGGESYPTAASLCEDWLEVVVDLTFATDDGSFDESATVSLVASDPESPFVDFALDPSALSGRYEVVELEADQWDVVHLMVYNSFRGGSISGDIRLLAERTEAEDGAESVSDAAIEDVLVWPAAAY